MSALVLLHGFTGSPASFDAVRAHLRADVAVHAPVALGHAGAEEVAVDSFDQEVDRLAAGIASATAAPRVLAGYSMGGRLALGLLVRHPGLFARVVAIGAHPGLEDPGEREARRRADDAFVELLRRGLDAFLAAWEAQPIFATQARAPREALEAQRRIRRSHSAAGLERSLHACGLGAMPPMTDALSRSHAPLELVVGEDDAKFISIARAMGERTVTARLHVVPGAGHNVPLEAPRALARILEAALLGADSS